MSQTIHAFVGRYFNLLNTGDFGMAREIVAPDFMFHGPSAPQGRTLQGLAQFIKQLKAGFPDKHFEEVERVTEGNKVVSRYRMTGTHDGIFHGIPPTGKFTEVDGCDLFYFRDGKIAKVRAYFDFLALLRQVGAIPNLPAKR